jgi:predicted phage tail protein
MNMQINNPPLRDVLLGG